MGGRLQVRIRFAFAVPRSFLPSEPIRLRYRIRTQMAISLPRLLRFRFSRRLSLLEQFVARGLLVTVIVSIVVSLVASQIAQGYVLESTRKQAAIIADSVLSPAMGDHVNDPSPEMAPMWQRSIRPITGRDDIVAVKVWASDGTIVYAENTGLIGQVYPPDPDFVRAQSGISSLKLVLVENNNLIAAELERSNIRAGEHLYRIYVPVTRPGSKPGSGKVVGIYELYQRAAPLEAALARITGLVWLWSFASFGVLFGTLYALVRVASRRLEHLAYFDALTGLANRRLLRERAEAQIALARRNGSSIAMLYMDLNRFKAINDSLGHGAGDDLLKQVANRLQDTVRQSDTLARLGGDEFALVIDGGQEDAVRAAQRITQILRQPFRLGGQEVTVQGSIGIALLPEDAPSFDDLTKHADIAMYRAKHDGGGHRFYQPELDVYSNDKLRLEQEIRTQLEGLGEELEVHFQPIVRPGSLEIAGFESLVRWRHPERGLIPPGMFLPTIEDAGLDVNLDRLVLERAISQNAYWRSGGWHVRVTVNLSSKSFNDPHLTEFIRAALERHGLPARSLIIEITEGTAMRDETQTLAVLLRLKNLGVWVALDDFGVGHSSLAYLKRFPIDLLKLDRSFLQDLEQDKSARMLEGIIGLAGTLQIAVVVEGVETPAHLEWLRGKPVSFVQGYLTGKPAAANSFAPANRNMA
jgi:diguanylate cyclase (GGDEF)-like protein